MTTIVFFLEEPSAREMLKGVLPRLLSSEYQVRFIYIIFQGKQDLEKNLEKRLRGWRTPNSVFVVLRDQDSGDCTKIKSNLIALCQKSGKDKILVRIACRELESFYLGDLEAVEKGLELSGLAHKQNNSKYRSPDNLNHPADELGDLTDKQYQKIAGSRAIAPYLKLEGNRSPSFNVLLSGIKNLLEV
ncbi:MAG: DUF4276 family protein [Candidatus Omnitrophota bacterium]